MCSGCSSLPSTPDSSAVQSVTFATEMQDCFDRFTAEQGCAYVECVHGVERKYGQAETLHCRDAGPPTATAPADAGGDGGAR
jgi:hypothetical protein